MSDFIRPEARAALWRWREALAGGALGLCGLWAMIGPGRLVGILGLAAVVSGIVLIAMGVQRGRFRRAGGAGGLGMVDVDEGQVVYFGPLSGGALALADVQSLALLRSRQSPHWRLTGSDPAQLLLIPTDASGAEALFDAFATLPGLRPEMLVSALADEGAGDIVIWNRGPNRPTLARLH